MVRQSWLRSQDVRLTGHFSVRESSGESGDQRPVAAQIAFDDQRLSVGLAGDAVALFAEVFAVEVEPDGGEVLA